MVQPEQLNPSFNSSFQLEITKAFPEIRTRNATATPSPKDYFPLAYGLPFQERR